MTLFGITLAFTMLLAALGTAMIVHSIVGKRRIVADFRGVSARIGGTISQPTVFASGQRPLRRPRRLGVLPPRAGEGASIIYVVYTLS
jgi:hypothetical protein